MVFPRQISPILPLHPTDFYLSTWTTSVHQFVYLAAFPNQKDFKYNPQEGKKRQQQDSKKRQLLLHINKQSRRRASPGLVNLFSDSLTPSEMRPYHPPALLPLVPTLSSFVGCTAVADSGKAPYGTMPDGREHPPFFSAPRWSLCQRASNFSMT